MANSVKVRTIEELKNAVNSKVKKIIVKGDLAEEIHKAEAIKRVSKPALIILGAALATMPITGRISGGVGVVGLTATTGMGITAITAVAFLGLALVLSITNDYDRKFKAKKEGFGEASMEMNKK